ncbi:CAP domain-containing protein [Chloroflexota bacterium]
MRNFPKYASFLSILVLFSFGGPSRIFGLKEPASNIFPSPIDLVNEVNNLRSANGLPPYAIDQRLMNIAQSHTDYQASIGTVTHYGPDGSRPYQRALAAGYPVAGDISLGGFFSENVAAGRNLTVSGVVISWQQDAPHLNTMLSTTSQDIGAGVTVVDDKIFYTIDVGLASDSQYSFPTGISQELPSINPVNIAQIITNTPQPNGAIIHVVDLGETLWAIAQVYGISVEDIRSLNNLENDYIFVGDQLIIREESIITLLPPTSTVVLTPYPSTATNISQTPMPTIIPTESYFIEVNHYEENNENLLGIILSVFVFIGLVTFALFRTNISKNNIIN